MESKPPDRNVYILGAGFTAAAGPPIVRHFLDVSRKFLVAAPPVLDDVERAQFEEVFGFKRRMWGARDKFSIDLDNLENLFGLVEASHRLFGNAASVRASMIYLIAKTLQLTTETRPSSRLRIAFDVTADPQLLTTVGNLPHIFRNPSNSDIIADMYDYFAAVITGTLDFAERRSQMKDTIITLNYDLVCDDAVRRLGFEPDYHLAVKAREGQGFDILKLHGSANWGVCTNPQCRRVTILNEKFTQNPRMLREDLCTTCGEAGNELLLVPPTWDKAEHRDVIRSVWSRAVDELKNATRICIIGYSMPEVDAFFKYLLTMALAENEHLEKLVVVDIDGAVEDRYAVLLDHIFRQRRFVFHQKSTEAFLGSIEFLRELSRGAGVRRYVNTLPMT